MFDTVIKNGMVATAEACEHRDLAIKDGVIAAVGMPGTLGSAEKAVDASGKIVMPGLIDPHIHIRHPFKGGHSADDFYTATRSAAFGGNTMVCDFAIQWDREKSITEVCENRKKEFENQSVVDYSYHACPTTSTPDTIKQLGALLSNDIPSVKLYMTYSRQGRMIDDAGLFEALRLTAQHGGIVGVHAENDALGNYYSDQFIAEGKTSPDYFPRSKDNLVEAEAVNRALYLAKVSGGSLYIFHLSCRESLNLVRKAKAEGVKVCAETCTHYLTMDLSQYSRPDGANFICSPPLRSAKDVTALWQGIQEGLISIVSSDHCGFSTANKSFGNNNFSKVPGGLPGVETRLPAMFTYGVKAGKIDLCKLVELLSSNPAKAFGMYPRKGALSIGSDADIVLFDPHARRSIGNDVLHSPVDWSPFDGETLYGKADLVMLRGQVIIDGENFKGSPGFGNFVPRSKENMRIFD